jgi:putative tricarboxylic transport membrane protein
MADRVIFVCILILAGGYFWATEKLPSLEIGDPLGPKAFPRLLTVALLVTAAILLFEIIRGRKPASSSSDLMPPKASAENVSYPIVAGVVVWTFLFFLVFETLGYVIAGSIYLIALTSFFHPGKWMTNVTTSILFALGSYLMFVKVLGVNLARGILPF